jgi:hypothetical protein
MIDRLRPGDQAHRLIPPRKVAVPLPASDLPVFSTTFPLHLIFHGSGQIGINPESRLSQGNRGLAQIQAFHMPQQSPRLHPPPTSTSHPTPSPEPVSNTDESEMDTMCFHKFWKPSSQSLVEHGDYQTSQTRYLLNTYGSQLEPDDFTLVESWLQQ